MELYHQILLKYLPALFQYQMSKSLCVFTYYVDKKVFLPVEDFLLSLSGLSALGWA